VAGLAGEGQQESPAADPGGAAGDGRAPSGPVPAVSVERISKRFGRIEALTDVSLAIARGSVHALVGENGAGKSTLGKIIAGAYVADEGEVFINGERVVLRSPREALDHGIVTIAQELSIVPQLSVAQNVMLGTEPRAGGFVRQRSLRRAYEAVAATVGFELPAGAPAGRLRVAEQQQVEIMRALSRDAQVIIMDEPTAALSRPDSEKLHKAIRSLAGSGKTILLISHFLREVLDLADAVTVLRDGRVVMTTDAVATSEQGLVEAMLGRPLTAAFPPRQLAPADAAPVLTVRNLSAPGVKDVSFELRAGEIVGLAGLIGAGRTELARAIMGATKPSAGAASTPAHTLGRNPRQSLRAGVAMIPESRKDDGLILTRSVLENVSLPRLGELSSFGVVHRRAERRAVNTVLDQCDVRGAGAGAPVRALSGGNQQKLLFARMFLSEPRVVIADEPTRGVDVGAKRAIYDMLVSLAADGLGVLLISSELEEIIGLSHRVLVMRGGRIVAELAGEQITERAILTAAFADVENEAA
jgi:rhamnose transport system ATP-binding protein